MEDVTHSTETANGTKPVLVATSLSTIAGNVLRI